MKNSDQKPPHGLVTATPFFFLLTPAFIARTGMRPIPELHVATDLKYHGPVYENDPDTGFPFQVAAAYLVKLMDLPAPLLINSTEMHPINSHVPDGICKHRLRDEDFLSAAQIVFMNQHPIMPN